MPLLGTAVYMVCGLMFVNDSAAGRGMTAFVAGRCVGTVNAGVNWTIAGQK